MYPFFSLFFFFGFISLLYFNCLHWMCSAFFFLLQTESKKKNEIKTDNIFVISLWAHQEQYMMLDSGCILEMRFISDNIEWNLIKFQRVWDRVSCFKPHSLLFPFDHGRHNTSWVTRKTSQPYFFLFLSYFSLSFFRLSAFSLLQIDAIVKCLWPHNKSTSNCKFVSNMCTRMKYAFIVGCWSRFFFLLPSRICLAILHIFLTCF